MIQATTTTTTATRHEAAHVTESFFFRLAIIAGRLGVEWLSLRVLTRAVTRKRRRLGIGRATK